MRRERTGPDTKKIFGIDRRILLAGIFGLASAVSPVNELMKEQGLSELATQQSNHGENNKTKIPLSNDLETKIVVSRSAKKFDKPETENDTELENNEEFDRDEEFKSSEEFEESFRYLKNTLENKFPGSEIEINDKPNSDGSYNITLNLINGDKIYFDLGQDGFVKFKHLIAISNRSNNVRFIKDNISAEDYIKEIDRIIALGNFFRNRQDWNLSSADIAFITGLGVPLLDNISESIDEQLKVIQSEDE